jgi:beta-N-acetylhexosaminidase
MSTRRAASLALSLALAFALSADVASATSRDTSRSTAAATPGLEALVGQRMVVAMQGTVPDTGLLTRIRLGRVGGVILFGSNIVDASQVKALTATLQAAARAGGRPPLLIATDQEGGLVRRLSWAPPVLSAQQLGGLSPSQIHGAGRRTGSALHAVGINLDLAPVADVPRTTTNFIAAKHRAFASNRYRVADDATAFATGLEAGGVLPAMKHFPGLGRAGAVSTDDAVVRILATRAAIDWDLFPYRIALGREVRPVIMLSTAVYPAYSTNAAAFSAAIGQTLLRQSLGFGGVTITDSLNAAARVRGATSSATALRAALAGDDLLLLTGSEADSGQAYLAVLRAARAGTISLTDLQASYKRIIRLKGRI